MTGQYKNGEMEGQRREEVGRRERKEERWLHVCAGPADWTQLNPEVNCSIAIVIQRGFPDLKRQRESSSRAFKLLSDSQPVCFSLLSFYLHLLSTILHPPVQNLFVILLLIISLVLAPV